MDGWMISFTLTPQSRVSTGYEPLFSKLDFGLTQSPRTPDRDIQFSVPEMTNSEMDEVTADPKLNGKTKFLFLPSLPRKEDYFVKSADIEMRRSARTKKTSTPAIDGGDETHDAQATLMTTNNSLRGQLDYNERINAKDTMELASNLLDTWVSDGIKVEIVDYTDAKEAYDFVKKRYAVIHEHARGSLLNQLNELNLEDCSSVTKYTNKLRQIKADLKTVKYDMTDDMFVTALLHGLPPSYRGFK
ncbi:hypothetical protein VN97_g11812 [Penicillium thymicola]|uniref:Uncharacterized protein n=1 Tax=Penicillium thymicola TaxID=293382 RepID=A0AAI9T6J6_PENTH|nr:hypothetical protein VN97_g11812 [Penicillium thymicola]